MATTIITPFATNTVLSSEQGGIGIDAGAALSGLVAVTDGQGGFVLMSYGGGGGGDTLPPVVTQPGGADQVSIAQSSDVGCTLMQESVGDAGNGSVALQATPDGVTLDAIHQTPDGFNAGFTFTTDIGQVLVSLSTENPDHFNVTEIRVNPSAVSISANSDEPVFFGLGGFDAPSGAETAVLSDTAPEAGLTVTAWLKVELNGVMGYIPFFSA